MLRGVLLAAALLPAPAPGQVPAEPTLRGRVLLADSALQQGTVVLHRIGADDQGELDSTRVAADGSFTFRLPSVPDPERSEVYFASLRHQSILYFGAAVTLPVQLDSLYTIQVYDTTMVSDPAGRPLPVEVRNLFLEPEGDRWRVTDLFQVRSDETRTMVATAEGAVWRYPLPPGATEVNLEGNQFLPGGTSFADGHLVVRTALPPGQRLFVLRYVLSDPGLELRLPGLTETLEVLVREPAPPLEPEGLQALERVELEPGSTYRRFGAQDLRDATVRLVSGRERRPLPLPLLAVLLSLALAAVGLWATLTRGPEPARTGGDKRDALIREVATLDRDFDALGDPSPEERATYERRRRRLVRRLTEGT